FFGTPYGGFTGGGRVAGGGGTGDGIPDIVTGAGPGGGPHVRAFDGLTGAGGHSLFAYDSRFPRRAFVALGDLTGDGVEHIITGAGAGGGPHVKVFNGLNLTLVASFLAYDAGFPGGVQVAGGDVNADGRDDIITGAGAGGGPHVKIFSGSGLVVG